MKIISLFSGAGGLDLGFENTGFEPVIALDISAPAVNTYNYNRKKNIAFQSDLSKLSGKNIVKKIKDLNVADNIIGLIGGPPCQYFSNGNKSARDPNDVRRILPIKYAKILKALNQEFSLDFFVFENVDGLVKPKFKHEFEIIIDMLGDAGFNVKYKVLNAFNFGVAQKRERVIIVGLNKNKYPLNDFEIPSGQPSGKNIRDVIYNIPEPKYYDKKLNSDDIPIHPNHWTMVPKSKKFFEASTLKPRSGARSFRRLRWDAPSYTVAYGHNEIHIHPNGHRRLSIYEALLLQGFPPKYVLKGNFSQQVILVSDAVPPPLAKAIALAIKKYLLAQK